MATETLADVLAVMRVASPQLAGFADRIELATAPAAPGVDAAKHWHDLYRKECRLRQDDAARYGQQIVDLEATAPGAGVRVDGSHD